MRNIIVIGGGLSGLYAAYAAAYNGANVTLYDKGYIGDRSDCGEMFTEVYTAAPNECIFNRIRYFNFRLGDNVTAIDFGENSPFVMTDKKLHELTIKQKCKDLGVIFKECNRYKYTTESPVETFIIDASGINGIFKYNKNVGLAVVYTVRKNKIKYTINDNTALFIIRDDLKGYKWYFPKNEVINVGEGVYDILCQKNFDIFNSYLTKGGGLIPMPDIIDYYNNISEAGNIKERNLIKVGNAAGLVNPILGGGEHLAVISGLLAGCLVSNNNEDNYTIALNEIIGDEMRFGCSMYQFFKKINKDNISELINNTILFSPLHLYNSINNIVRKAMRKWITIPISTNYDLEQYIKE